MTGFFSLHGRGVIRLALCVAGGAVLLAALFWWMTRPDFQVLFTELEPADASAVVEALEKRKVPYQLADQGRSVLVDRDVLYPMRMKLLGDGLDLKGTVGLELFSQTEYGMTEFSQKINYLRALQGELARTVMGFDEVRRARVHLALADSSALRRREPGAKASVWVTLAEGRALQREQVSGIQRLVASAVPALSPSAVTVLDHRGVALSLRASDDDGVAAEDVRLQWKKDIETHLAQKAAGILDGTLGPERATVAVDVALDPSAVRLTRESVLGTAADGGGSGVLVRKRERRLAGDNPVPGPDGASAGASRSSDSIEAEYLAGREVRQTVLGSGAIRRIGVGVVLREALPDDGLARLRDVISLAVGLDTDRGDGIAFTQVGAALALPAGHDEPAAVPHDIPPPAPLWLPVLLLPVVACVLVSLWRRRARHRLPPVSLSEHERARLLIQVRRWLSVGDEGKTAS